MSVTCNNYFHLIKWLLLLFINIFTDDFTKKRNYVSTVLRLIVYPIFVLILMKLIYTFTGLNDSKQILLTVYIASITPACATVTSMAQLYDKDAAYASSLYVLTTLLSIVTMPVMVGMYEMFV